MTRKKTVLLLLCLLFVVSCLLMVQNYEYIVPNREPYFIDWVFNDDISCHYVTEGDALFSVEELTPPPSHKSIFFLETSCRGGLNSRQACAVESAARVHPDRSVYVFFNSPVSALVLSRSCLAKLTQFQNVRLARLHTEQFANGTALGELFAHREHNHSKWRIEHTADMLRFVTLYKYGGVYLDTDVVVMKPLDALGINWVAREDEILINVAAFGIDKDGIGHQLVSVILDDIKVNYRPTEWVYNGPGAMNRALLNFCNSTDILELTADKCHGFNIYKPSKIYPVHWAYTDTYFEPGDLHEDTQNAYMHHMWNKLSHNKPIDEGSPYDKLAWVHCPTIRAMYGDQFGS